MAEDSGGAPAATAPPPPAPAEPAAPAAANEAAPATPEPAAPSYAENATHDFATFQQGLRESHRDGAAHYTVVGHSYGSAVAGYTARDESLPVDDFVSVGSPGLGVDNAAKLDLLPGGRVWATESHNDFIADIGSVTFGLGPHGADPAGAGFGSQAFSSDPGPAKAWGDADYTDFGSHDRYFFARPRAHQRRPHRRRQPTERAVTNGRR